MQHHQRELFSKGLIDVANLCLAALVFGQLASGEVVHIGQMVLGVAFWVVIYIGVSANLLYGFEQFILQNIRITSFTYLESYADSRMACQLIEWQLARGFGNMKPSTGNA